MKSGESIKELNCSDLNRISSSRPYGFQIFDRETIICLLYFNDFDPIGKNYLESHSEPNQTYPGNWWFTLMNTSYHNFVKAKSFRRTTPLQVSPETSKCTNSSILISGPARSGTSLLGNLIASFRSIEYSYEPNLLWLLLRLNRQSFLESWKLIYETFLYEDLFLGEVSGRSTNLRTKDESSIFRHKDEKEIQQRLEGPGSRLEIQKLSVDKRLAVKIPDIVDVIPSLSEMYPGMSIVIAIREPIATINSWLSKAWLSDKSLMGGLTLFPFRKYKNFQIPHFIPFTNAKYFVELSERDRVVYYLNHVYELINLVPKKILIRYEDICSQPNEVVRYLSTALKTTPTNKTDQLILQIRQIENLHQNVPSHLFRSFEETYSKYQYLVNQSDFHRQ